MGEVLQANIFFVITSIAVVVFTILACVALFILIKILLSVRTIVDRVETQSEVIAEDVVTLRNSLKDYWESGTFISRVAGLFQGRRTETTRRIRKRKVEAAEADINDND